MKGWGDGGMGDERIIAFLLASVRCIHGMGLHVCCRYSG